MKIAKRILQWLIPIVLVICCSTALHTKWKASEEQLYTFTITSKWRSASVGKHSVSEYNYFSMCLVNEPTTCINRFGVRSDTWEVYNKGNVVSFELSKEEVYPVNFFTNIFCFISLVIGIISCICLVGLVVWGLLKLYGEDE